MKQPSYKEIMAVAKELHQEICELKSATYQYERDENYDLIVNVNHEKIKLPVVPLRSYQNQIRRKLFEENIKRILICWPRRSGKEYASFEIIVEAAITEPGLYLMVYPTNVRARAILWEGYILLKNGNKLDFKNMIPKSLVSKFNNQEMKIHLTNGSIIWVMGSDIDPDKLKGTNPRGIIHSELAFQDPRAFYAMMPALRQNSGWLIGQSTFDGMNHFYQLIENNKTNPLWHCVVESITTLVNENGNRYITDEMVEEDRRAGMPEYLIQQEYYGVVEINQETRYFAHEIKHLYENNRIIPELILKGRNVYSAFDIGMEGTSCVLFQVKPIDNYLKPVIIGYFEYTNRSLGFFITEIRQFCAKYNLVFKHHFVPHDAKKRNQNTMKIEGEDTIDFFQENGEIAYSVPRPISKITAIESMRKKLYLTEFNKENTQRLIDCLSNYAKEYDEKMNIYKARPVHNWASHGVDAYQTLTLALDGNMISDIAYEIVYYNT